ncbi:probable LRR receptor-like serine/threonine-protein kinase At1g05700 isoform X3 [Arabidopsis lyrata subsp. lyrata]|uniref:probable LRR receptor-like serine/threonine-protein kinase At1g05700 isoform X3 n=1 Tax=Arabidopsis lyrata subsp. lyrata TaxID=81972 RepID=UPI000A29A4EC|nr:probable LRR receptor-like serine/threonine-protein kinase At1g05700 isoform X3 [Arabidopsis lyrata subsp. lyrata]|eukprot:XP_020869840.1 probable LRR receptor-like serine/threonine-protein kinase At1g05700 isoform X3 [Arabidopsis lyrata subsp. lyrata]
MKTSNFITSKILNPVLIVLFFPCFSRNQTKMETFRFLYLALFALCLIVSVLAQDQSGFISIDCGIPSGSSYKDDTTGINYVSDSSFVETGISKSIPFTSQRQLQNLRSFPEGSRNCYTLIPVQGKGRKYLIRASFMYGNYDGENDSPEFDLFLGGNIWDTVLLSNESSIVSKEVVYLSQSENIFVCLGNKGKGTPFISTLELRFLGNDNTTYDSPNGTLFFSRRWDFGSLMDSPVRYDEDVYDRIWIPRNFGYCREINTSLPVTSDNNSYSLSSLVMSTAMTPTNTTRPITMTLEDSDPNVRYFVYMHLAEVEDLSLKPNQTREFDIGINGVTVAAGFSPKYLQTNTFFLNPESQSKIVFSLVRTPKSTLPPIVNALEIYIANRVSQSLTNQEDGDAVTSLKTIYKVKKNWQGDPCLPNDYIWEGLNCSYDSLTPPRITSLNLSSSGLTGHISPSFSNLTMIQELNLEKNKLTGSVPSELLERSNSGSFLLRVGENPGLCIEISCRKSNSKKLVIPLAASLAALFILLLFSGVFWRIKNRRNKSVHSAVDHRAPTSPMAKSENKLLFTFADVVKMTNNFGHVLGKGGFGTVYHGFYDNLQVAVKLLSETSAQGFKEFRSEVEVLVRVHHVNLTALIGYFHDADQMGLIYEFMANGNMADHLAGKYEHTLSWTQRLQIALDAAQGLEYLHCGCKPPIVHRDVKTSNILLNDKNRAKLADFGLSRSFHTESRSHVSTLVAGTPGYLDPLCFETNGLNEKSDIYSFGVVLLEMITGKSVINETQTKRVHVSDWVISILRSTNDVNNVIDSKMAKDFDTNSVWKVVELALASVSQNVSDRPNMQQIVRGLKECLQREEGNHNY